MKVYELEVYSETINCPVIRFPQRKYPGVLIQGDTLKIMADTVAELISLKPDSDEFKKELNHVAEQLSSIVLLYEKVLRDHGISLPYVSNSHAT